MQVQKELPGEGLRSQISHFGYSGHDNRAKDNGREAEGDLRLSPSLDSNMWSTLHRIISFSGQLGPFDLTPAQLTGTMRYHLRKC